MRVQVLRAWLLVTAAAAGLVPTGLVACTTEVPDVPVGAFSSYTPPADGSGYGQMIDQPMPLPPTSVRNFECEWMDEALPLLAPLNIRYANGTMSGCQMGAGDTSHEIIQVRLNGPYKSMSSPTVMLEPVEIAGLHGRKFLLDPPEDPTFCTVELDVGAYAAFTVDAFDHRDFAPSAPDNSGNCELATKAAEILVKRYVPLAGGTPFDGTRQRPDDKDLRALAPCEFVRNPIYSPVTVDDPKSTEESFGTSCTYEDDNGTLRELMTNGDRWPCRPSAPARRRPLHHAHLRRLPGPPRTERHRMSDRHRDRRRSSIRSRLHPQQPHRRGLPDRQRETRRLARLPHRMSATRKEITVVATVEEITHSIEEEDGARTVRRAAAATRVGELARRRAAVVEQLNDLERELGDVLAESSDVIEIDELARYTKVKAADLARWLNERRPPRARRKRSSAEPPSGEASRSRGLQTATANRSAAVSPADTV